MFGRLVFLALLVAAVWYGSKHYKDLLPKSSGDVEVVNHTGRAIERLRISAGSRTQVVETLENDASRRVWLQPDRDDQFRLVWVQRGVLGEHQWTGGTASANAVETHRFEFGPSGDVTWTSELKAK